jgi:hypothetical protein
LGRPEEAAGWCFEDGVWSCCGQFGGKQRSVFGRDEWAESEQEFVECLFAELGGGGDGLCGLCLIASHAGEFGEDNGAAHEECGGDDDFEE